MIRSLGETLHSALVRDLVSTPLSPITQDYAKAITSREADASLSDVPEQLIRENEMTDALIINTPMHNFTAPAALKLWIDYVLRVHRTFAVTPKGKLGLICDGPTFVIVVPEASIAASARGKAISSPRIYVTRWGPSG